MTDKKDSCKSIVIISGDNGNHRDIEEEMEEKFGIIANAIILPNIIMDIAKDNQSVTLIVGVSIATYCKLDGCTEICFVAHEDYGATSGSKKWNSPEEERKFHEERLYQAYFNTSIRLRKYLKPEVLDKLTFRAFYAAFNHEGIKVIVNEVSLKR